MSNTRQHATAYNALNVTTIQDERSGRYPWPTGRPGHSKEDDAGAAQPSSPQGRASALGESKKQCGKWRCYRGRPGNPTVASGPKSRRRVRLRGRGYLFFRFRSSCARACDQSRKSWMKASIIGRRRMASSKKNALRAHRTHAGSLPHRPSSPAPPCVPGARRAPQQRFCRPIPARLSDRIAGDYLLYLARWQCFFHALPQR
jgi:hypothetical protein